jgi:hypothetical protein
VASSIYDETDSASSPYFTPNIVTVAKAMRGRCLCKTIYGDGRPDDAYDKAKLFKFFSIEVYNLHDIAALLHLMPKRKQSCFIRGIAKDDSKVSARTWRDDKTEEPTIIEQPQNWFAIDVDQFGKCTGNIKQDAETVLLALGLENTECIAIPSANYNIKPSIRLRLFLWNNERIGHQSLKNHFKQYADVIDLKQFHPIQPIYTARPNFINRTDPCNVLLVHLPGAQCTNIAITDRNYNSDDGLEYTVKAAKGYFNKIIRLVDNIPSGYRHNWLIEKSIVIGKRIGQELLDYEECELQLLSAVNWSWEGDLEKNAQTIRDGFKRGMEAVGK